MVWTMNLVSNFYGGFTGEKTHLLQKTRGSQKEQRLVMSKMTNLKVKLINSSFFKDRFKNIHMPIINLSNLKNSKNIFNVQDKSNV